MEAQRHIESAQEEALSLDLRRTLVLGRYLQAWSMPEYRIVMTGRQGRARIEIYFSRRPPAASRPLRDRGAIPPSPRERSGSRRMDDGAGRRPGRGKRDRVCAYLCDLIAHSIENTDGAEPPRVMGPVRSRRRNGPRRPSSSMSCAVKARRWSASRSGARRSSCNGWCPSARRRPRSSWIRGSMRSTRMSRAWRIPSSIPRGRNRPLNRPRADTRCTPSAPTAWPRCRRSVRPGRCRG